MHTVGSLSKCVPVVVWKICTVTCKGSKAVSRAVVPLLSSVSQPRTDTGTQTPQAPPRGRWLRRCTIGQNWRLPLAAEIVKAVQTLSDGNRPRKEDFAGAQLFSIWASKVAEAREIFRRHYDRNATKTTTGRRIVGLCARLAGFIL